MDAGFIYSLALLLLIVLECAIILDWNRKGEFKQVLINFYCFGMCDQAQALL